MTGLLCQARFEAEREDRSLARLADHRDIPAHHAGKLSRDRKAKASATIDAGR